MVISHHKSAIKNFDTLILFLMFYFLIDQLLPISRVFLWSRITQLVNGGLFFLLVIGLLWKSKLNSIVFILPVYILDFLFNVINGDGDAFILLYGMIVSIIPLLFWINYQDTKRILLIISNMIIILTIFTACTTIIGLRYYPEASRILATFSDKGNPDFILYSSLNIGGFSFIYTIMFLIPILTRNIMNHKKIVDVILLVIIIICVYFSQYTIAIIFSLVALISWFFKRDTSPFKGILFLFFGVLILYLLVSVYTDFFYILANRIRNILVRERVLAVLNLLFFKEATTNLGRFDLWIDTLNVFRKYFLFGGWVNNSNVYSQHSFIFDFIAKFGMLGILALIIYYRSLYKEIYFKFKKTKDYFTLIFTFILAISISIINPINSLLVYGIIIPIAYRKE